MSKSSDWALREEEKRNGDDGYDKHLADLEIARMEVEQHIKAHYYQGMPMKELFSFIWEASTHILPNLEVQVVIDSNNKIHVSSGSAGYVDFQINPVGMKLPIKCWIHTHPFGSAYFSSTDWRTVNTWEPIMEEAFVLGGYEHYGYWNQNNPTRLIIHNSNGSMRIQHQVFSQGDEEE